MGRVVRLKAMTNRVLLLLCAACSTHPTVADPAEIVAVPLTAASSSALQQTTRADLSPPWSLTASDGSGLMVTRVDAKAVFEGPLAFTELHLYFHNPENRRREGTFQITLPAHAAVSRFAMENDGQWMEAEVVDKQLARRAYDDFLHRRQDPALLEKAEGNQFTAKVFPIAAGSDKHIVISYSQQLPGAQYVLPLRGLPKTERVDVELAITGADGKRTTQQLAERNWEPDRDFVSNVGNGAAAVASGNLVAAQIVIEGAAAPTDAPRAITLLVDTSASRGLGYDGYIHDVRALIGKLAARYGAALPLDVIAFDQDHERIFSGRADGWGDAQDKRLVDRGAAGASDLGQALADLGDRANARVIVVTDGVITAGLEHAALATTIKHLAKVDRLDVVLAGGIRDDQAASELVRAGLPHAGAVLDLDTGVDAVASALAEPVRIDVPIEVPGATWVFPRTLASARAGTSTMVYARLAKPAQSLDVVVGGASHRIALLSGTAPLIERAIGSAEIDELEAKLAMATPEQLTPLRAEIATKSVAARVISSQTSMLVLERDADYARYGIDRKALADVLVVGPSGIVRTHREAAPLQLVAPEEVTATKQKNNDGEMSDLADKRDARERSIEPQPRASTGADESGPGAMEPPKAEPPPPMPVADAQPVPSPQRSSPLAREQREYFRGGAGGGNALEQSPPRETWPPKDSPVALTGELAAIEHALGAHDLDGALAKARDWHAKEPGNVLALIGLGDALEAKGSAVTAARVYGSIIDLFPGRADMRRFAGERLARLSKAHVQDLVIDTYRRAVVDRPDHLTGHRLYAYALLRAGKPAEAFAAVLDAIDQPYRNDSYAGGERTLADDAGMIGTAYVAAMPQKRAEVIAELAKRHFELATTPSTRFILYWETDANDVDFHIQDAHGGHAFYGAKQLPSGGELYADITTGYGPECFAIPGTPKAGPYRLSINYYSQGPMGYGMGLLEIQRFDGKGVMTFEDRPYVIMNDHAYVDLGLFQ